SGIQPSAAGHQWLLGLDSRAVRTRDRRAFAQCGGNGGASVRHPGGDRRRRRARGVTIGRTVSANKARGEGGFECWSYGPPARTATLRCRPTPLTRASALTNARFARTASTEYSATSVRI